MHTVLLVTFAPFVNLIILFAAGYGARKLSERMPEGRLKRIMYFRI